MHLLRDRKRKRFIRDTGKEDKKNKIKTESGQVVSAKKSKKNLYPFIWRSGCSYVDSVLILIESYDENGVED